MKQHLYRSISSRRKLIIRLNNIIIVMLAKTIKLLKKSLVRLVGSNNDIEKLTKNLYKFKV